jgi:DNA-binding NarL/FixJ family response regulator|uniref:OmpR-like transcriptional regulator n=2 Tax=Cyanidioschyzon merolae TaxID=45157 RepID=Q85G18_CYAM1|nr:ompR-like transcriptional regulator [Cyanidioschyzon merolae strain 10D]QFV16970.1 ompR-like transcriptional regulator [Cyanidioschyzon merolae]QFV17148.1 ompR-like transcriptional regulator [Cyanidioschyzon merolae]BAC76173.1 ompR-like transcriptional regulator [Cyanidioschyzon merolae strain 10D]
MSIQLLLIDDDQHLTTSLQQYLQLYGIKVLIAHNGRQGIELLKSHHVDLVVCDVIMPEMNGYDVLKFVQGKWRIILLTAKGLTQDRIRAYQLGCDAYITKPFDPDELLALILAPYHQQLKWTWQTHLELTPKEQHLLNATARGLFNKQMAEQLAIAKRNVERYSSRLLSHTHTQNRAQLLVSSLIYRLWT